MRGVTLFGNDYSRSTTPGPWREPFVFVVAVTHPPKVKELKHVEATLDKWEEQGKVLKKDFGENFSDIVRVGIVTAMMPESIQKFVYSSLGIVVEHDIIFAKIRVFVPNRVPWQVGQHPWMSTRCPSITQRFKRSSLRMIRRLTSSTCRSSAMDVEVGGTASLCA